MKRLLLLSAVSLFLLSNVAAQGDTPILLNYKTLAKKAASSDEQIANPKKGAKSSTWVKRGKIFQDVYNQGLEQLPLGTGANNLKIFYGNPLEEPVVDSNNVEIYKYETINYHFEYGKLRGWTRNNPIVEDPLDIAMKSYFKAIELEDSEKQLKLQQKIKSELDLLKDQFQNSGQSNYFLGDYLASLKDFESILKINELPVYEGIIDTLMINFSGIVAREVGRVNDDESMYRLAISYYKKLTEMGYQGTDMYIQMTRDYYSIGDTLGAIENLKRGLEQYQDSSILVMLAAQAYYLMGENEEGSEFVDNRISQKPDDAVAYYWKGLFLTNRDDLSQDTIDMALELYEKSLEIDPSQTAVWYQAGYVYYAVGANYFELEGYEDNEELRQELTDKGLDNYRKAVVKLEKTYELAVDDQTLRRESLDLLKRIYYKLYGSEDERYNSVIERQNM